MTATDSVGATVPHKTAYHAQGSNDKPLPVRTQLPAG
ncbi:hypothetical protein OH492_29175 [Vibrio chagasii]|nr:hypothetical protein [Vibrio chagasii]